MKILANILLFFSGYVLADTTNAPVIFKKNHPLIWVVTERDTINDVASLFLENPWRWNEAWGDQAAPSMLIQGDKIKVNKNSNALILIPNESSNDAEKAITVKLGPEIIATPISSGRMESTDTIIPYRNISAFISKNRVFESQEQLHQLPKIVASDNDQMLGFHGGILYAKDDKPIEQGTLFNVFRQNIVYMDHKNKELLGIGTYYIGQVTAGKSNKSLTKVMINTAHQEFRSGDIMVPVNVDKSASDFVLRPSSIKSKVIAPIGSLNLLGKYASVVIHGGAKHGVKRGHVFSVFNPPVELNDEGQLITFKEDQSIAQLLIYKVFQNVSYGIILAASEPVESGDVLRPALL